MTRVSFICQWCGWGVRSTEDDARADQVGYLVAWQHIMASHRDRATDLKRLSVSGRKASVMQMVTLSAGIPT